jgi:hypothetical protein
MHRPTVPAKRKRTYKHTTQLGRIVYERKKHFMTDSDRLRIAIGKKTTDNWLYKLLKDLQLKMINDILRVVGFDNPELGRQIQTWLLGTIDKLLTDLGWNFF